MNTCDTCKHWGEGHRCESDDFKFCTHPKVGGSEDGPDTVTIYHDIDSGMMMGPKFGCIHWNQKQEVV